MKNWERGVEKRLGRNGVQKLSQLKCFLKKFCSGVVVVDEFHDIVDVVVVSSSGIVEIVLFFYVVVDCVVVFAISVVVVVYDLIE